MAGLRLKGIANSLGALHDTTVNKKAAQNATAVLNCVVPPLDATELYNQVRIQAAFDKGQPTQYHCCSMAGF